MNSNKQLNMKSNKQLNMWKHLWDVFISDVEFRKYYTNYPSYDLVLGNETPIVNSRGTLYIPPAVPNGQGHFIAYQMNGNKIEIFDPSAYAYQEFSSNPNLQNSIGQRSGKSLVKLTNHPQDLCKGDTFCQTWSLAWLKPNLRQFTNAKNVNSAITSIYNIVSTVAKNNMFKDYMLFKPNQSSFNKIIKEAQEKFKIPDSTCLINNVQEFVKFSRDITRDDIERIMTNKT